MAGSKYAYVRNFELPDALLPGTFIVLRLDGHGFHRFSEEHAFVKPNDERALALMNYAAQAVMEEFKDIVLAFGESDEYSFLFRKSTTVYNRRSSKILTTAVSLFTSTYVMRWGEYFPDVRLHYAPSFDGRIILYPSVKEVRDYFAWRQADTHINNLYNTAFWALVQQGGETTTQAHATLRGTVSAQKHDILFSKFNINYNTLSACFRKGSVLVREEEELNIITKLSSGTSNTPKQTRGFEANDDAQETLPIGPLDSGPSLAAQRQQNKPGKKKRLRTVVRTLYVDVIGSEFWTVRPEILAD